MKNLVRFAVTGALVVGSAAHAAVSLPSSNASDLFLFVSDTTANTTFVEDTGQTIASLMPSSTLSTSSNAVLSTAISDSFTVAASSALSSYISGAAGHTLEWAVEGVNFPGNTTTKPAKSGNIVSVFSNTGSSSAISSTQLGNIQTQGNGFEGDASYFASSVGSSLAWSAGTATGNVWGASNGSTGGSTTLYGTEPDQASVPLATNQTLYGLTGNGTTGQVQSFVLATLQISSNGTLSTVSSVPLPAAVWLFGSGLLGLVGVGRRRSVEA